MKATYIPSCCGNGLNFRKLNTDSQEAGIPVGFPGSCGGGGLIIKTQRRGGMFHTCLAI